MAIRNLAAETRRTRKKSSSAFESSTVINVSRYYSPITSRQWLLIKWATPQAANNFLKTVRALMQHCIEAGMRTNDPTHGIRGAKVKTDGYRTCTEVDIEAFEARHPVGSRARLALALLLYTAQRRSDVVRMGRQHLRDGALSVRQQKTGR